MTEYSKGYRDGLLQALRVSQAYGREARDNRNRDKARAAAAICVVLKIQSETVKEDMDGH